MHLEPLQSILFLLMLVAVCFSPLFLKVAREKRNQKRREERRSQIDMMKEYDRFMAEHFPIKCKCCKEPIEWDSHYQEWVHRHSQDPYCA